MDRGDIKNEVARNINQLASNETTITSGIITETWLNNNLNYLYRKELAQLLIDKFPADFRAVTTETSLYTAMGTVSASSTSTTLVASTAIFTSDMIGYTVQNTTDDETAIITGYTNTTTLTLDTAIGDTWDGDTIYVLGAEYGLGGVGTSLKEIENVWMKYASTDTDWVKADMRRKEDLLLDGNETYFKDNPKCYMTTVDVADVPTRAIGFRPFPDDYTGKFYLEYTKLPPELTDDVDVPSLDVVGIGEALVCGLTYRAFRTLKMTNEMMLWKNEYNEAKANIIRTYKPITRSGPSKLRGGSLTNAMRSGAI